MGEGEEEKGGSTPVTPTSTSALPSPLPSGAHNKKNFTFVHCQSQILKRRQGDGQSVQLYVSVDEWVGGRGAESVTRYGQKNIYLPVKLAQSKEKTQQQQQQRRQRVLLFLLCRLPCIHTHSHERTHAGCAHLFIGSASTSSASALAERAR